MVCTNKCNVSMNMIYIWMWCKDEYDAHCMWSTNERDTIQRL